MAALLTTRHLIATACSAAAVVAATTAVATWPAATAGLAACPNGEDTDTYTGTCVPYLVPNSPTGNSLCPPGVGGTECGSAEIQPQTPPPMAPQQPEQVLEDINTPDY
jgi:hypothetical protein